MKKLLIVLGLVIALLDSGDAAASVYTQSFGLDPSDTFGTNPFSVSNAFIRHETFAPNVQYWQPATPNAWSEVVYRFDVPFVIDTAATFMAVEAFTVGHPDANFDSNAQSFLDISTDGISYTNIFGSYPGHAGSYDTFTDFPNGDGDISAIVQGSSTVYIRARQYMTVDYAGFNGSQFLRHGAGSTPFFLTATGSTVPEPSSVLTFLPLLLWSFIAVRNRS